MSESYEYSIKRKLKNNLRRESLFVCRND